MRVRLSAGALRDAITIRDYIAEHDPAAAERVVARIGRSIGRLGTHPLLGRTGTVSGTRELLVARLPYLVIYRLQDDPEEAMILRIYHTSRQRP